MHSQRGRQDKLQWWLNRCVMLLRSSRAADMWLIQNSGGMDHQLNQTWVCPPTHSKTNLLTLGDAEGKCSVNCRCKARRTWNSKDPESPVTLREGVLKAMWETGLQDASSTHAQFSEGLASIWRFKHHQLSGFNQSRVSVLVLAVFIWCGSASYKTSQECVSVFYLYLLGNREFGDSAMWLVYNLNCYQSGVFLCVCSPKQLFFVSTFSYFLVINSWLKFLRFMGGQRS